MDKNVLRNHPFFFFFFFFGLNIFYLVLSVHTFIDEHIVVQALGLERKQYAYRVLLPTYRVLLPCHFYLIFTCPFRKC